MDSTTLISKYLKEYNCLYKEANEIYHEAARRLHLSDSAFEIFYALFDMGDNCLQRDICKASCQSRQSIHPSGSCRLTDISLFLPEKDEVCISILQLPARS